MRARQIPILSRARDLIGVNAGTAGRAGQVLRLEQPGAEASFAGPLRLVITYTTSAHLRAIRTNVSARNVDIEVWRREVFVPSGHQYRVSYTDLVGPEPAGCLVITAHDVDDTPTLTSDLPCDFAVTELDEDTWIFPPSCEPCDSTIVRTPPSCGPVVPIPVAKGGCVRPRFFSGMFITREDMETQLRYFRIKQRLQNRAMGEGVVWGLPISLDASRIHIGAGYAVDCCGNNLTVTCDYSVRTDALLSDPDLCGRLSDLRCASIVLEYAECAEHPRPVHGESCGQATPACEMSRIRETVRLRLRPPCDDHEDALAAAFSEILEIIRPTDRTTPDTSTGDWQRVDPSQPLNIAWSLAATGPSLGDAGPVTVNLDARHDQQQTAFIPVEDNGQTVDFAYQTDTGARFSAINIVDQDGNSVATGTQTPRITFDYLVPAAGEASPRRYLTTWETDDPAQRSARDPDAPTPLIAEVRDPTAQFRARAATAQSATQLELLLVAAQPTSPLEVGQYLRIQSGVGTTPPSWWRITAVTPEGASTRVTVQAHGTPPSPPPTQELTIIRPMHVRLTFGPAIVEVPGATAAAPPCCGGFCCDHTRSLDPNDRLLVLILILYYARILQELEAIRTRTRTQATLSTNTRRTINTNTESAALRAAAASLSRTLLPARLQSSVDTLRRFDEAAHALLNLWCHRAIYPGPSCDCGCGCSESHESRGVVIGCAYFRAGQICRVSPYDGRRWVLHPPLLQHWASAFGFPALDQAAMGLFSRLCCISALPSIADSVELPERDDTSVRLTRVSAFTSRATVSGGPEATNAFSALPHAELFAQPMAAMRQPTNSLTTNVSTTSSSCASSFMAAMLRLLVTIETVSPAALVENVSRFLCHPLCNLRARTEFTPQDGIRLDVARNTIRAANREPEAGVQPVLRDASAELSALIVARAPVTALPESESIRDDLNRAGVTTVADLLTRSPRDLSRATTAERTRDVNASRTAAEAFPAEIAGRVARVFANRDRDGTLQPEDLASEESRERLERDLTRALTVGTGENRRMLVDEATLTRALDDWSASIRPPTT